MLSKSRELKKKAKKKKQMTKQQKEWKENGVTFKKFQNDINV